MLVEINKVEDILNLSWKKNLRDTTFAILYPDGWKSRPYDEIYIIHNINLIDPYTIKIDFADGDASIIIKNLKSIEIETDARMFSTLTFKEFEKITVMANHKIISDISTPETLQLLGHFLEK